MRSFFIHSLIWYQSWSSRFSTISFNLGFLQLNISFNFTSFLEFFLSITLRFLKFSFLHSKNFPFSTMASANSSLPTATAKTSTSTQESQMDDPLFLHHGERTSTILVTQSLTGNENYPTWGLNLWERLCLQRINWVSLREPWLFHLH